MYAKRRTIPMAVTVWMEKDVKVRKATASSGLMPDNTRYNVFLSRKFFSNMLNLSSERYHQISRFDYDKKMFLKTQRHKAEKTMPGLLPYIDQHISDKDRDPPSRLTFNKNEQLISSLFQSSTARSSIKSDLRFSQKRKKKKTKYSDRQQISLERINHLAQPKRDRFNSTPKDHIRPNHLPPINVQDIFGNMDDLSNQNFLFSNESKTSTDDKRFRQLIHLFSEVNERKPNKLQSVKSLIQSNESLQNNSQQSETKNILRSDTIEEEYDQEILNDSSYTQTDMFLIDACA